MTATTGSVDPSAPRQPESPTPRGKFGRGAVFLAALTLIAGLVVGGLFGPGGVGGIFGTEKESLNTQVVRSLSLDEQVVLMSLGIQGIATESIESTILGVRVPGSGRTQYLQYAFDAKLGIEGDEVSITQTGDKAFTVTIPDFIFIGHNNEEFKIAVEDNGVLSFVTPEVDTVALIQRVLSDDARDEHVESNREVLEQQATNFYTGIIKGIDHEIDVDVKFRKNRG